MGSLNTTEYSVSKETSPYENRIPIITPRHVPANYPYERTPYSMFDPALYKEKFAFPAKEPPRYY